MQLDQSQLKSGFAVPLIAVISNPKSTQNSMGMDSVRAMATNAPNVLHVELSDMSKIDEALDTFARANATLLVVNGGDGTIGAVLSALLYRNPFVVTPPIAFMPGGQTNMTAADLGYDERPAKVLSRLLRAANSGQLQNMLTTRNLIEIDLNDGSLPRVGTFFGAAGIVKAIHWCRENGYAKGLPKWLAHSKTIFVLGLAIMGVGPAKDLIKSRPMTLHLSDGRKITDQFSMVYATTLDKLLLGLRPFARGGFGGLKLTSVRAGSRGFLSTMKSLFTGKWSSRPDVGLNTLRTTCVEIEGDEAVTLDGEMIMPVAGKPLTVRGDKQLTFVRL